MSDIDLIGASSFDQARFREVLGHFASGVTVVTTYDAAGPAGFTCQSFMSLSLDPPLIAIAPSKSSDTWPRLSNAKFGCVNFLCDGHESLARNFAGKGQDKFEGVGYRRGSNGAPILDGCLAWLECSVDQVYEAGDHFLVSMLVTDLGTQSGEPIIFYRGGFGYFHA